MSKLVGFVLNMMIAGGKKVAHELDEVTKHPKEEQQNVLRQILSDNKNSEFGKRYGFAEIGDYQTFTNK